MKLLSLSICAVILLFFTSGPSKAANMEKNKIEGNVTYRERIAMPPDAKIMVTLYENGKDGMQVIEERRFPAENRNVPIPFKLEHPKPSAGKADYMLKALILAPDNRVFAASRLTPVDLSGTEPVMILTHVGGKDAHAGEPAPREIEAPASYLGEIRSNDALSKITLRLGHDHGFTLLRETARNGEAQSGLESGRWMQIAGGHALELGGNGLAPLRLLVRPGNILVFADRPESGGTTMELHPMPDSGPWPNARMFTGALTRQKHGFVFRDCVNGVTYPVSEDGAYEALKQTYLAASSDKRLPLQVRFEGHLIPDSRNGKGLVAVDRLDSLVDEAICPDNGDMGDLTDRYWKLLEIDGKKALVFENQTEPHILLQKEKTECRLSGSDGCNRLVGMADITEKGLKFGQLGSTMMLCPQGAEQSAEFVKALSEVNGWRVFGDVLELLRDGDPVLTFEAVLMR